MIVVGLGWWLFAGGAREAQVSGKVMLEDEAVAGAQIVFAIQGDKSDGALLANSTENGSYKLLPNRGPGIRPGKYKVAVVKMAAKDGAPLPQGEGLLELQARNLLINVLPRAYADQTTTPLEVEVRGGNNTIDLLLKRKP